MKISGGWGIARRYFIMNGFDGILTVFGVIMGSFLLDVKDPRLIIGPGIGASVAIGVSGFWIAYLTEEAEQIREKEKMEKKLFTNLDNSMFTKAARISSFVNSVVDGMSPFLFGLTLLIPFILVELDMLTIENAYFLAFLAAGLLLFILGMILGVLSNQNRLAFGLKTTMAGIVIIILLLVLNI